MLWPNDQYTKLQIRRSEVKPKLDQWVVFLGTSLKEGFSLWRTVDKYQQTFRDT